MPMLISWFSLKTESVSLAINDTNRSETRVKVSQMYKTIQLSCSHFVVVVFVVRLAPVTTYVR